MENDEEFLHVYFTYVSQLCFDKAKEHVEKERENNRTTAPSILWISVLCQLQQLALAERSYMEIGFLQNKNKGFLRKDNSLKSIYESIKIELKRIEDMSNKQTILDKKALIHCNNVSQFVNCRICLIDFYEKVYMAGANNVICYGEALRRIENQIQRDTECFTNISLTPMKAIVVLECSILEQLFRALTELQRLQFLPSLALIHGAHARITAWENKIQNRESWKLGFLKNNQLPALFQWHLKFKGSVLSKFSFFFHDTLASQTTSTDMKQQCSKLQFDYFNKICSFQKKYDATSVFLLSDNQVSENTNSDTFPVIVSYPPRPPLYLELTLKMISDAGTEFGGNIDKIIYKYSTQEKHMLVFVSVEPNIYLGATFDTKKTERDTYISNFMTDICSNLRCTKLFVSLKTQSK